MTQPARSIPFAILTLFAACSSKDPAAPDASIGTTDAPPSIDAAVDAVPPEPKPAFQASGSMSGQLAIDDVGVRETFIANGQTFLSVVTLFLTEAGATTSCELTIRPAFTQFGFESTSNRQFKTVTFDVATSTVVEDKCGWDDAYMLAEITNQFGATEIGFTQARFAEDRPALDVLFDAEKTFPGNSANITAVAGGAGFPMAEDGTVDLTTRIEPPGGTLIRGLYQF